MFPHMSLFLIIPQQPEMSKRKVQRRRSESCNCRVIETGADALLPRPAYMYGKSGKPPAGRRRGEFLPFRPRLCAAVPAADAMRGVQRPFRSKRKCTAFAAHFANAQSYIRLRISVRTIQTMATYFVQRASFASQLLAFPLDNMVSIPPAMAPDKPALLPD